MRVRFDFSNILRANLRVKTLSCYRTVFGFRSEWCADRSEEGNEDVPACRFRPSLRAEWQVRTQPPRCLLPTPDAQLSA